MSIVYRSNNSGGYWWLGDDQWRALEAAGWSIEWAEDRWLDSLATVGRRYGLPMGQAVKEWERITGACASSAGCACCGRPHDFHEEEDDLSPMERLVMEVKIVGSSVEPDPQ